MRSLLCAAALLGLCGAAHAAETIRPGYWESTNRVMLPGAHARIDRRCITPQQVAKYVQGPSNHIYDCEYPEHSSQAGVISFRGTCTDKKGRSFPVSGSGSYTPTTLKMTAAVKLGPLTIEASTDAHRLGDVCPAPAPGEKAG